MSRHTLESSTHWFLKLLWIGFFLGLLGHLFFMSVTVQAEEYTKSASSPVPGEYRVSLSLSPYVFFANAPHLPSSMNKSGAYRSFLAIPKQSQIAAAASMSRSSLQELIAFGASMMIGLNFLVFFLLFRRIDASFYFSLMCFSLSAFLAAKNPYLFAQFFSDLPIVYMNRFPFLAFCATQLTSLLFLKSVFPEEFSQKILRPAQVFTALIVIITFAVPEAIFRPSMNIFMMVSMPLPFYSVYVCVQAFRHQREGSAILVWGLLGMVGTMYYGFFVLGGLSKLPDSLPIYFLVLCQALILAQRFSNALDTTEQLSEELATKNQDLLRVDQLKNEFLANTSHELRTPLNGIIGLAESLRDGATGLLPDQTRGNLSMIIQSGKRLTNLVNDLLDFSKLRHEDLQLQLQSVGLKSLAEVVLTLSRSLKSSRSIKLTNNIPSDIPRVLADESRLQQILFNLIGNALKFTNHGHVVVSAKIKGNRVALTVSDTGIGIEPENLQHIFQPFEQADSTSSRSYGGTGLGLAITKELVELHEGELSVRSTPGEGSHFTFTLPIFRPEDSAEASDSKDLQVLNPPIAFIDLESEDELAPPATLMPFSSQESFEGKEPGRTYTILIVDDEPINIQVLYNYLTLEGYEVLQAFSGTEMLEQIEMHGKPDLVILDVMMPVISGYEACRKLRERFSIYELPVLMFTAKTQVVDLVEGFLSGANDYITKPCNKDELLSRIRTHLELSLLTTSLKELVQNRTKDLRSAFEQIEDQNKQLKETQMKLVQSEKATSLGTLVAGVVHEISNPNSFAFQGASNLKNQLNTFQGLLYNLVEGDTEACQLFEKEMRPMIENTESILVGSHRIREIIKGLRTFSRLDEADRKTARIIDGLESSIMLIQPNYKHFDFSKDWQVDIKLDCWPAELNQAFLNILINACQAIEKRQRNEADAPKGLIHLRTFVDDELLGVAFSDNGSGIPQDIREKIFEPFFTTREVGEGTGLGLSISFGTIKKHKGYITVDSKYNEGSTFTIWLPTQPELVQPEPDLHQ